MTNYREILRLHSLGLNKTEIAASCQCAENTVAGEVPYQSTQFNKYYADYLTKLNATMHLNH